MHQKIYSNINIANQKNNDNNSIIQKNGLVEIENSALLIQMSINIDTVAATFINHTNMWVNMYSEGDSRGKGKNRRGKGEG